MQKKQSNLSIIILTHNNENCIDECIYSIDKYVNIKNTEIIIVDNNSTDKTISLLNKFKKNNTKFKIKIIKNKTNLGVAKGRNIGLKKATGKFILFLDSDTIMVDDSIKIGINFLKKNKDIGIVVPKMFYKNLEIQDNIRYYPTIKRKIKLGFDGIKRKFIKSTNINTNDYLEMRDKVIFEVDYGIGAYTLMKDLVVKKIGFYDEKIFYGPEDADYCLRAKLNGFKTYYNGNINIIHERQRLAHKKIFSKMTYYHIKGLIYYFHKHRKNRNL